MELTDVIYVMQAHSDHPTMPSKAVRKWDNVTPYFIHPLWCATMIAAETSLDRTTREEGALVLLYHDILEDTAMPIPEWISDRVRYLINDMTFEGGSGQEMKEIWSKPKEARLYKLYDKVSNLLDGAWMSEEKRAIYEQYTMELCRDVENNYGALNITRITKGIIRI